MYTTDSAAKIRPHLGGYLWQRDAYSGRLLTPEALLAAEGLLVAERQTTNGLVTQPTSCTHASADAPGHQITTVNTAF